MLGGQYKGKILFGVGLVLTLVVIAILLYVSFSGFTSSSPFKSGFNDMKDMDPLTRFYAKNKRLKEMYATMLNVDSGTTMDVYKEFVDNPGKDTPRHIYDKAIEVLQEMPTMDLYGQTNDVKRLFTMIINMDAALTDVLNSKFYTADRVGGADKRDTKLLDEYSSLNVDGSFEEYLRSATANDSEADIKEDMINAIHNQDYDVSRYVESLERDKTLVSGVSSKQMAEQQGRRHRLEFRPYPGSSNPRVIADDEPFYKDHQDVSKDRNIPSPGILNGKTRDIEFYSTPWPGRRANEYTLITN